MFKHFLHVSLSEQASNMKDTAEVVKAALDESERAQSVAMDAIQLAQNNTKGTLDLLVTVSLTSDLQDYSTVNTEVVFTAASGKNLLSIWTKKTWEKNWKLWTQHTNKIFFWKKIIIQFCTWKCFFSFTYEEKHHRSQINKIFTQFHTWKKKSYKNRNYSVSEKN